VIPDEVGGGSSNQNAGGEQAGFEFPEKAFAAAIASAR
jgi:hypothetical protein